MVETWSHVSSLTLNTNGPRSQLSWVRGPSLVVGLAESHRHGSSGVESAVSALLNLTVALHQQGKHLATQSET